MGKIIKPEVILDFTDYVSGKFFLLHKDKEDILKILNTTEKLFYENNYFYQTLLYNYYLIDTNFIEKKSVEEIFDFAKNFISEELLENVFATIVNMKDYDNYRDYFMAIKNSILLNPAFGKFSEYYSKPNEFVFIDKVDEMVYKDENFLYYGFSKVKGKDKKVFLPDNLSSFKWVEGTFFTDNKSLYTFYGKRYYFDYLVKIKKCDLSTLEVVGEYYAKDKNRIFYTNGKSLLSKSSSELSVCDDDWSSYKAKDKEYVYIMGKKLKD